MLIEEIKNIKNDKKELKKFGLTIGAVLFLIGAVLLLLNRFTYPFFMSAGILFAAAGILFPVVLKPIQILWMTLAVIMGFIMTRVILSILFYIVITPIGFLMRIAGKDLLNEKFDKKSGSYWNKRETIEYKKEFTERQF